jgi:hypothetical protein
MELAQPTAITAAKTITALASQRPIAIARFPRIDPLASGRAKAEWPVGIFDVTLPLAVPGSCGLELRRRTHDQKFGVA